MYIISLHVKYQSINADLQITFMKNKNFKLILIISEKIKGNYILFKMQIPIYKLKDFVS